MDDYCTKLAVIPQFTGTCWFNAILMVIFYSQLLRDKTIKYSKKWNNESLFNFFKTILKYNYSLNTKYQDLFTKVKPEVILMKIMNKYDLHLREAFNIKKSIVNDYDLIWGHDPSYICNFLRLLKIPYLTINYLPSYIGVFNLQTKDNFIFNYPELKTIYHYLNDNKKLLFSELIFKNYIKDIQECINDKPEVLIIDTQNILKYITINFKKNLNDFFSTNFNLETTDYKSIINYDEIIIFNGCKYKLDSCILNAYKYVQYGHAIAGITCNNNKYVYNGWNQTTIDPGIKNTTNIRESPCSLMKYDWDVTKDIDFCLNNTTCKLDPITKNSDLCFNFKNKNKILIYVKIDEELNKKDSYISNIKSASDISNKGEIIYNYHNINKSEFKDLLHLLIDFNLNKYDMINKNNYEIIKDVVIDIINSFYYNIPNNQNDIKKMFAKYKPELDISKLDKNDLYWSYYDGFFHINKPTSLSNDANKLIAEIKGLSIHYKIPDYYSIFDLNQMLFDLYKIKANFDVILNYLTNDDLYYKGKGQIEYIYKFILLISKYFPDKINANHLKALKNLAKLVLNDIYHVKEKKKENKDEIIKKLKEELEKCKQEKNKIKTPSLIPTKLTKVELINKIKKIEPNLKGLAAKKKEELLLIYNKLFIQ